MVKTELNQRSPIRVLEKSIHGGLGRGNLGVFASKKGVGKTACLAHVALDCLLRGEKVLHVSFADNPSHIESWYEHVFQEMAATFRLEDVRDVHDEIVSNRLIVHFRQSDRTLQQIRTHIDTVTTGSGFMPSVIVVDGFSFTAAADADWTLWKEIAAERKVEIWFSATLPPGEIVTDAAGIPAPVAAGKQFFSVIILLHPLQDHIDLKLLKDHDSTDLDKLRIKLDPRTLLIANHRA
jgi:hypothetical protein